QQQIAVLAEVRVDAELVREVLEGLDAVERELDAHAVGVLMADSPARERGRARAHSVALEHDDAADAPARQMIRRARAHDAGADPDDVRRFRHCVSPLVSGAPARPRPPTAGNSARSHPTPPQRAEQGPGTVRHYLTRLCSPWLAVRTNYDRA